MSKARKARGDTTQAAVVDVRLRKQRSVKTERTPLDREVAAADGDGAAERKTKPAKAATPVKAATATKRRTPSEPVEPASAATAERKPNPRAAANSSTPRAPGEPTAAVSSPAPVRKGKSRAGADEAEIVNVRRRQGRSVETRRKILDGAMVEFATAGFEGATTRSIAERAEVPHGLVIYHFETKLGVWQAVMERVFADLHEQWERVAEKLRGSDPETILRASYRNFIEFTAARPEHNWMFSHEVSGQTERLHWLLDKIRGRDLEFTLELIRQVQAAGRFVEGDPAHLHFLYVGAASRVFGMAPEIEHYVGASPFDRAFVDRHVELCERLFFRDPGPPADAAGKPRPQRRRSTARPRG